MWSRRNASPTPSSSPSTSASAPVRSGRGATGESGTSAGVEDRPTAGDRAGAAADLGGLGDDCGELGEQRVALDLVDLVVLVDLRDLGTQAGGTLLEVGTGGEEALDRLVPAEVEVGGRERVGVAAAAAGSVSRDDAHDPGVGDGLTRPDRARRGVREQAECAADPLGDRPRGDDPLLGLDRRSPGTSRSSRRDVLGPSDRFDDDLGLGLVDRGSARARHARAATTTRMTVATTIHRCRLQDDEVVLQRDDVVAFHGPLPSRSPTGPASVARWRHPRTCPPPTSQRS
jgi:hypothetical protein